MDKVEKLTKAILMSGLNIIQECEVEHTFVPGIYMRTLTIQADRIIIGEKHKTEHLNIITEGECLVRSDENDIKLIKAPYKFISKPGVKKTVYTITKTVWSNVHPNPDNTTDVETIRNRVIDVDYENQLISQAKQELIQLHIDKENLCLGVQ